jgi:hypothetical protein
MVTIPAEGAKPHTSNLKKSIVSRLIRQQPGVFFRRRIPVVAAETYPR